MSDWSWNVTPPAAATGFELSPECLEWLGVDVFPSVSTQEEKEGETE